MLFGGAFLEFEKSYKSQSTTTKSAIGNETSWIWNTSADSFDLLFQGGNRNDRIWFIHFIQLSVITIWLSGMFLHGARFSNYSLWMSDPIHIHPCTLQQPILYQESLNVNHGIQITSGYFHYWSTIGIDNEYQLYTICLSLLSISLLLALGGLIHQSISNSRDNVYVLLNHHIGIV